MSVKPFFQSIVAKKSKIVDKIGSKLEGFKEGWSKNSFGYKVTFKI
jgi:hypothetical protein